MDEKHANVFKPLSVCENRLYNDKLFLLWLFFFFIPLVFQIGPLTHLCLQTFMPKIPSEMLKKLHVAALNSLCPPGCQKCFFCSTSDSVLGGRGTRLLLAIN